MMSGQQCAFHVDWFLLMQQTEMVSNPEPTFECSFMKRMANAHERSFLLTS